MSHGYIPGRNFEELAFHIFLSEVLLLLLYIDTYTFGPHLQTCKSNYMEVMLKYDHEVTIIIELSNNYNVLET